MSRSRSSSMSAISALIGPDSSCSVWLSNRQPPVVFAASASRPGRSRTAPRPGRGRRRRRGRPPARRPRVAHRVSDDMGRESLRARRSRARSPRRCGRCWGRGRPGWPRRGRGRRRRSRSTGWTCAGPGTSARLRSVNRPAGDCRSQVMRLRGGVGGDDVHQPSPSRSTMATLATIGRSLAATRSPTASGRRKSSARRAAPRRRRRWSG